MREGESDLALLQTRLNNKLWYAKDRCSLINVIGKIFHFAEIEQIVLLFQARAAMVEWLRCLTHAARVLCSNISISGKEIILGKSYL